MDAIRLKGMRFEAFLGATEGEARRAQPVELDVELWAPLAQAGRTDDLGETIDYGRVFEDLQAAIEGKRFHLLEAIAERAAQVGLRHGAEEVLVRARKFDPPVKGTLPVAEVEVLRAARADRN